MESKEIVNERFIEVIEFLTKSEKKGKLASELDISTSKFSEILNKRMKAGIELYCSLVSKYNINAHWLLTGEGSMIKDGASIEVDNLPYKELYNDMKIEFTKIMGHLEQINKDQKSVIEAQKALIDKLMALNRD